MMTSTKALFKLNTVKYTLSVMVLSFGFASHSAQALDAEVIADIQLPLTAEFKQLDQNANSHLTPVEASKDALFTANHFAAADANQDGVLSEEEFTQYKSEDQKRKMALLIDDSTITAKVKAELLAEKNLKSLQISVQTRKGQVILSGFVDDQLTKDKAETIVSKINGVKSVKNSLVIKS